MVDAPLYYYDIIELLHWWVHKAVYIFEREEGKMDTLYSIALCLLRFAICTLGVVCRILLLFCWDDRSVGCVVVGSVSLLLQRRI